MSEQKRKFNDQLREKGFEIKKSTGNNDFVFGLVFHENIAYSKR